jgi:hypothetical protein
LLLERIQILLGCVALFHFRDGRLEQCERFGFKPPVKATPNPAVKVNPAVKTALAKRT